MDSLDFKTVLERQSRTSDHAVQRSGGKKKHSKKSSRFGNRDIYNVPEDEHGDNAGRDEALFDFQKSAIEKGRLFARARLSVPHPVMRLHRRFHPVPETDRHSRVHRFDRWIEQYGYYVDEMVRYVLLNLPTVGSGGQSLYWDPMALWSVLSQLCYATSVNKYVHYKPVL